MLTLKTHISKIAFASLYLSSLCNFALATDEDASHIFIKTNALSKEYKNARITLNDQYLGNVGDYIVLPLNPTKVTISGAYSSTIFFELHFVGNSPEVTNYRISGKPCIKSGQTYISSMLKPTLNTISENLYSLQLQKPILKQFQGNCQEYASTAFSKYKSSIIEVKSNVTNATLFQDGNIIQGVRPNSKFSLTYRSDAKFSDLVLKAQGFANCNLRLNLPPSSISTECIMHELPNM